MSAQDGTEPIEGSEILYRRVPASMGWFSEGHLSPQAFDPRDADTTGLSVSRGKYKSAEEAARGMSKKGYYVAAFLAEVLIQRGIRIVPRPLADDPSHAELPDLNYGNRLTDETRELMLALSECWTSVDGPFHVQAS